MFDVAVPMENGPHLLLKTKAPDPSEVLANLKWEVTDSFARYQRHRVTGASLLPTPEHPWVLEDGEGRTWTLTDGTVQLPLDRYWAVVVPVSVGVTKGYRRILVAVVAPSLEAALGELGLDKLGNLKPDAKVPSLNRRVVEMSDPAERFAAPGEVPWRAYEFDAGNPPKSVEEAISLSQYAPHYRITGGGPPLEDLEPSAYGGDIGTSSWNVEFCNPDPKRFTVQARNVAEAMRSLGIESGRWVYSKNRAALYQRSGSVIQATDGCPITDIRVHPVSDPDEIWFWNSALALWQREPAAAPAIDAVLKTSGAGDPLVAAKIDQTYAMNYPDFAREIDREIRENLFRAAKTVNDPMATKEPVPDHLSFSGLKSDFQQGGLIAGAKGAVRFTRSLLVDRLAPRIGNDRARQVLVRAVNSRAADSILSAAFGFGVPYLSEMLPAGPARGYAAAVSQHMRREAFAAAIEAVVEPVTEFFTAEAAKYPAVAAAAASLEAPTAAPAPLTPAEALTGVSR